MKQKVFSQQGILLNYYEAENDRTPLVLLHAQAVDGKSYRKVARQLSKRFHLYSLDWYGHGLSLHDPSQYHIRAIGDAVATFIRQVIGKKVWLLGHSGGGLIAAYIAASTDLCEKLILEDPPFFACQGERRKTTFNYVDLSTVCHDYLAEGRNEDFVLYYFERQYAWNLFPENGRDKAKAGLLRLARARRRRHPEKDFWIPFWPRAALAGYQGMNRYDPRFGLTFYDDSFHAGIGHEELLRKIFCPTLFMKAKTEYGENGLLMAALSEEDLRQVMHCIKDCTLMRFDCGHGIHMEQPKAFVQAILQLP